MNSANKQRTRVRRTYDLASSDYDSSPLRFFEESARRLVEFSGVRSGDIVLDIGTGTGWVALAASARVGPRSKVVGIDLSPKKNERARAKARRFGPV